MEYAGEKAFVVEIIIDKYFIFDTRPTIDELDEAVIDKMVNRDKAFWVDKPGANDYTLHDAYYSYGIFAEVIQPSKIDFLTKSNVKHTSL